MTEQLTLSNVQEQLIAALEKSKAASKTLEECTGEVGSSRSESG
jgi:hypothetical protein